MKIGDVESLDESGYRKFGLTFAVVVAVLFGIVLPWLFSDSWPIWPWMISAIFVGVAFAKPKLLSHIYKPWMIFGHYMGLINSKIILALLFAVIITPVALVFKVLRKDPMRRKLNNQLSSYWESAPKRDATHMRNIY